MLILSRHVGERIMIDPGIVIEVVRIDSDRVKLGITAPAEVPVWREEVWKAIQKEGGARCEC